MRIRPAKAACAPLAPQCGFVLRRLPARPWHRNAVGGAATRAPCTAMRIRPAKAPARPLHRNADHPAKAPARPLHRNADLSAEGRPRAPCTAMRIILRRLPARPLHRNAMGGAATLVRFACARLRSGISGHEPGRQRSGAALRPYGRRIARKGRRVGRI